MKYIEVGYYPWDPSSSILSWFESIGETKEYYIKSIGSWNGKEQTEKIRKNRCIEYTDERWEIVEEIKALQLKELELRKQLLNIRESEHP